RRRDLHTRRARACCRGDAGYPARRQRALRCVPRGGVRVGDAADHPGRGGRGVGGLCGAVQSPRRPGARAPPVSRALPPRPRRPAAAPPGAPPRGRAPPAPPLRTPERVAPEGPPASEPTPLDPVAPAPDPVVSPAPRRRSRGRRVAVLLAAIAATAGAGAFLLVRSPNPPLFAALAAAFGRATAPTPEEARALVEQFRQAHEERDAARLAALFAPDATGNGQQGVDDIARSYRDLFTRLTRISYALPSVSVTADGS